MRYCAFLRGVNVKGTSMKMQNVCAVFSNAGMHNVTSVLASGNIIFTSEEEADILKLTLQKSLQDFFNYEAHLFIKNAKEVEKIFSCNPFQKKSHLHHYAFIGENGCENYLLSEFEKCKNAYMEMASVIENTFYWQIEKGNTTDSEFGKILGRKTGKNLFTSRNINTFEKILNKI